MLTPIIPGREEALCSYLESLPREDYSPFITMGRTYYARFVIVHTLYYRGFRGKDRWPLVRRHTAEPFTEQSCTRDRG